MKKVSEIDFNRFGENADHMRDLLIEIGAIEDDKQDFPQVGDVWQHRDEDCHAFILEISDKSMKYHVFFSSQKQPRFNHYFGIAGFRADFKLIYREGK